MATVKNTTPRTPRVRAASATVSTLPTIQGEEAPADAPVTGGTIVAAPAFTLDVEKYVTPLSEIGERFAQRDASRAKLDTDESMDWFKIGDLFVSAIAQYAGKEATVRAAFIDTLSASSGRNVATVQLSSAKTVAALFPPAKRELLPDTTAFSTLRQIGQGINKQSAKPEEAVKAVDAFITGVRDLNMAALPAPKALEIARAAKVIPPAPVTPAPAGDGRQGPRNGTDATPGATTPRIMLAGGASEDDNLAELLRKVNAVKNLGYAVKMLSALVHTVATSDDELSPADVETLIACKGQFDSMFG